MSVRRDLEVLEALDGKTLAPRLIERVYDPAISYYEIGVVERVPGTVASDLIDPDDFEGLVNLVGATGHAAADWHSLQVDPRPACIPDPPPASPGSPRAFVRFPANAPQAVRVLQDTLGWDWAQRPSVRDAWTAALRSLAELGDVLLHGDLHLAHVLIESGAVTGVIDWEACRHDMRWAGRSTTAAVHLNSACDALPNGSIRHRGPETQPNRRLLLRNPSARGNVAASNGGMLRVARAGVEDWEIVRSLRLRALAEAPYAFGSTLQRETKLSEEDWRRRFARGPWFVAWQHERPLGLVASYIPDGQPDWPELAAMWVDPTVRGRGVASDLVGAIAAWAASVGAKGVSLWVADGNERARRFYERIGFKPTGRRQALPSNTAVQETEMAKRLASG